MCVTFTAGQGGLLWCTAAVLKASGHKLDNLSSNPYIVPSLSFLSFSLFLSYLRQDINALYALAPPTLW